MFELLGIPLDSRKPGLRQEAFKRSDRTACRQPAIVEIQILRVGQLVVLCLPGELTTMAGRRLREAVHQQVQASSNAYPSRLSDTSLAVGSVASAHAEGGGR